MADMSIPLSGMAMAESRVNTAASRIAKMPLSLDAAPSNGPQDTVDLSAEMIALMESKNNFQANANVVQTYDQMSKSLLNILA